MDLKDLLSSKSRNYLYVDTTSTQLMVGLSMGDKMLFRHTEENVSHRYHSSTLIPTIQQGMVQMGLSFDKLSGLAVNIGPGSFTGIRTGITSVRTMAQFLEIPVFAFNSFEVLSNDQQQEPCSIFVDALRGSAYHAVVSFNELGPTYEVEPCLVSLSSLSPESLKYKALGSVSLKPLLTGKVPSFVAIESQKIFTPDAMLTLINKFPEAFVCTWQEVFPLYLQSPNITLRNPQSGRFN